MMTRRAFVLLNHQHLRLNGLEFGGDDAICPGMFADLCREDPSSVGLSFGSCKNYDEEKCILCWDEQISKVTNKPAKEQMSKVTNKSAKELIKRLKKQFEQIDIFIECAEDASEQFKEMHDAANAIIKELDDAHGLNVDEFDGHGPSAKKEPDFNTPVTGWVKMLNGYYKCSACYRPLQSCPISPIEQWSCCPMCGSPKRPSVTEIDL